MIAGDHHREDENGMNGRRDRRSAKRSSIQATWTYRRCLKSSEPSKRIDADINTVIPLQVHGTPTFALRRVSGSLLDREILAVSSEYIKKDACNRTALEINGNCRVEAGRTY